MWVLKGTWLGLVLFLVGSLVYVGNKMRPFEATGHQRKHDPAVTVFNVWYWIAFVACLALGMRLSPDVARTASGISQLVGKPRNQT